MGKRDVPSAQGRGLPEEQGGSTIIEGKAEYVRTDANKSENLGMGI